MKYLSIFTFTLVTLSSFAEGIKELIPQVMLVSSVKDTQLHENESHYIFEFSNLPIHDGKTTIRYSIDSIESQSTLDYDNRLFVKSTPGVHRFQFFYDMRHFEIYIDSLSILPQYINTYQLYFESSEFPVVVDKPVIYLYPEKEIDFTVKVKPSGNFSFTYPAYKEGWNGVVTPNGEIKINTKFYNYLFWESDQTLNSNNIDTKKGSIIKGDETLEFLEKQLSDFGFSSKEKADFITFWAPQLQQNEFNYIYFVLNNDADYFAELTITPQPDNTYRFYILTCPIVNPNDFHYLEPQLIESAKRKGFTVLEWGGSVIDTDILKKRLKVL